MSSKKDKIAFASETRAGTINTRRGDIRPIEPG
jgi:hypothetical protein